MGQALRESTGAFVTMGKKLIEVALPLEAISAACRADKDRKTGTIRNIHKWFAPMPAPAWRALLLAAVVTDPGSHEGRERLRTLIEELVRSESQPPSRRVLAEARDLIITELGPNLPLVVDPFCGGGSTLVEAQRLGFPSFGSDLNPIPVLISRVLTEIPPQVAGRPSVASEDRLMGGSEGLSGFLADVHHYGNRVKREVHQAMGHHYPVGAKGEVPAAWIWARTATCPNPACGATMPLVTSLWLDKRPGKERWLQPESDGKHVAFHVSSSSKGPGAAPKVGRGASFRCLSCGQIAGEEHIRAEGIAGNLGFQLLAVAADDHGTRVYLPASKEQTSASQVQPPDDVPDAEIPYEPRSIWCTLYGVRRQCDLYTPRQLVALDSFSRCVAEVPAWIQEDGGSADYGKAVATVLGLCIGKLAQSSSTQVRWRVRNGPSKAEPAFGRHDLPMVWDFAEVNPFGGSVGDWTQIIDTAVRAFPIVASEGPPAKVVQLDARAVGSVVSGNALVATDPPYFDNIGYADLSDYFYVWIRRALRRIDPSLFATLITPKQDELIASPSRHNGDKAEAKAYFVRGFTDTFRELAAIARPDLPMLIVYAFRQQESRSGDSISTGWEAMLEALLTADLAVVGTWPIHGTGATRQIGLDHNVLASYVVLVCRPRPQDAGITDRREFLRTLRNELPGAVRDLQEASIAPVDLAQSAIGPGMAIFSRFSKVVDADGARMAVGAALAVINQVLDEILSQQESEYDTATRWAIAWFEQHGLEEGEYGHAESLSKAKNVAVSGLVEEGFLSSRAGKVRLLARQEMDQEWDPTKERRLSVWEVTQHLVRVLEQQGEVGAATLLKRLGGLGPTARDLAYRLYATCERKKWAQEALAYNSLVAAWPEISRLAAGPDLEAQSTLGV
jgi:putative DNA methylase